MPVQATSEVVTSGENGQVSTIIGNGTAGQTSMLLDHPRNIDTVGGNIYFVDGSHKTAKLRMYNGKSIKTVVDLAKSPLVKRDKYFVSTGLAAISGEVFVSSNNLLYHVIGPRITTVDRVNTYLKSHGMEYLYRMRHSGDWIYIMYTTKSQGYAYGFIRYNPSDGTLEPVLDGVQVNAPNNFYANDRGIIISCQDGIVQVEKLFPRETITEIETNTGSMLDAWSTKSGQLIYSMTEDRVYGRIYTIPTSSDSYDDYSLLAGGPRGFNDGIADEVQVDGAKDFIWDGSGYLFGDAGNDSIRKLWLDDPPSYLVQ